MFTKTFPSALVSATMEAGNGKSEKNRQHTHGACPRNRTNGGVYVRSSPVSGCELNSLVSIAQSF